MWGRGLRGNYATCSALGWLSVTFPTTHKQFGNFWCCFPTGWTCVHSRTPWVSPVNAPVRLGASPATTTATDFYSQRFWGFIAPHWNPRSHGLSCSPVVPPSLSTYKCWTAYCYCLADMVLQPPPWHVSSLSQLPISTFPTSLNEFFFFNSLVVIIPYSSIFWPFWLFFVYKFVVVLLFIVWGGTVYLLKHLHLGWKSLKWKLKATWHNLHFVYIWKGSTRVWALSCLTLSPVSKDTLYLLLGQDKCIESCRGLSSQGQVNKALCDSMHLPLLCSHFPPALVGRKAKVKWKLGSVMDWVLSPP